MRKVVIAEIRDLNTLLPCECPTRERFVSSSRASAGLAGALVTGG